MVKTFGSKKQTRDEYLKSSECIFSDYSTNHDSWYSYPEKEKKKVKEK